MTLTWLHACDHKLYFFNDEYLEKNNFIVINKEEIDKKINWKDLNILFVNKEYQTIL